MLEISEFQEFHPRAVKLLRKKKNFIVIAEDEPYFLQAYALIREHEQLKGTWTDIDEAAYHRAAEQRNEAAGTVAAKPQND